MTKVKTEKSQTPYYITRAHMRKGNEVTTSGTGTTTSNKKDKNKGKLGKR